MSNDSKKKKKEFKRQNSHKMKRVPESWRKPRGIHSPMRQKRKHAPKMPNIGFRSPKEVRGRHPSGLEEVLVHTPSELDGLDAEEHAVRIGTSVGGRKREQIADKADDLDLTVLNYTNVEAAEEPEDTSGSEAEESGTEEDADTETDTDDDNVQRDEEDEE